MSVLGHGVDLVHIPAFQRLLKLSESAFTDRSFRKSEISNFPKGPRRVEHIASRFAAKEAVLKALGTGFGNGIAFTDIEILRVADGPPKIRLFGEAAIKAHQLGIVQWWLSISHSEDTIIASVIAAS